MIDAIVQKGPEDSVGVATEQVKEPERIGRGKNLILIDHEDSFVHTLGNYLRQTGATVKTLRSGPSALKALEKMALEGEKPDLVSFYSESCFPRLKTEESAFSSMFVCDIQVILSPGPGNPSDFGLSNTIEVLTKYNIPAFGVCLGLQGMVEHFGGTLGVLGYPMHGKPSGVTLTSEGKAKTR